MAKEMKKMNEEEMSSLQKEVWKKEIEYWGYSKEEDIDPFMKLWWDSDEMRAWPEWAPAPVNREDLRAGALKYFSQNSEIAQPNAKDFLMEIVLFGEDIATVYYISKVSSENQSTEKRIIHTWKRKSKDVWYILGGMSCPHKIS